MTRRQQQRKTAQVRIHNTRSRVEVPITVKTRRTPFWQRVFVRIAQVW